MRRSVKRNHVSLLRMGYARGDITKALLSENLVPGQLTAYSSFLNFTYFLDVLGLPCSLGFSLVVASRGSSNCDVQAFIAGASFAPEHKLWRLRLQYRPPPGSRAQVQWFWPTGSVAPWLVGSSQTRDQTHVSCIGRRILNHWITRGALFFIFLLEYNCFFFFWWGGAGLPS